MYVKSMLLSRPRLVWYIMIAARRPTRVEADDHKKNPEILL
jgi:hypothetical protein